jgi:hypothetical protein
MPIIPAIQEVQIGRIMVSSKPGQKVNKTPTLTNNLGIMTLVCGPSYAGGTKSRVGPR